MTDTSVYPNALDPQTFFLPAVNNLDVALAATLNIGNTNSIRVSSTAGWPTQGVISIDDEVIYYLALNSTSFLNLVRGFDGTIPATHTAGATAELRWIAAHHNRMVNTVMTMQQTLGINPQGSFPDVATRLDALFNSIDSRTNVVPLKNDRSTPTRTGYNGGASNARLFIAPESFVITANYGPEVYLDGINQDRSTAVALITNANLSAIQVNNGGGKGIITCNSTTFLSDGLSAGDIIVLQGTPNNDGGYIIDGILSDTQIRVTEIIFGSDQPSAAVGVTSIYDVNSISNPIGDFIAVPIITDTAGIAEGIVFLNAPLSLQQIRIDYSVQNNSVSVTYTSPVALLADYENPSNSGTISSMGSATFTLNVGRTRAIVYSTQLTATSTAKPDNVSIQIYGRSDITQLQYEADFIDLSSGIFTDYGLWHFSNQEDVPVPVMTVVITNLTTTVFNYTFTLQAEALGNNI